MKSVVAGVAGAVRINQLTMAGLTRAELHGKRLDKAGKSRAVTDELAVTTTGLELNALFQKHVQDAFIPEAKSKAMHVIVQFPKELVDGNDAEGMLHHAREFTRRVFGDDAIFADRIDRDEKSRHVVDLFIAPKYLKETKLQTKVAVSMTRDLKALAKRYGHPPTPHGTGRALQDALLQYLRDEMGLKDAQRGFAKQIPGPDHKAAEELRIEELETLKAETERARDDGRRAGFEAGMAEVREHRAERQRDLDERQRQLDIQCADQIIERLRIATADKVAHLEAEAIRSKATSEAKRTLTDAEVKARKIMADAEFEGREQGLADARVLIRVEQEAAAAAALAAKEDRHAAAADVAAAAMERAGAKAAGLAEAEQELSERRTAVHERESAVAEHELKAAEADAKAHALQVGIEAWVAGDIVRVDLRRTGTPVSSGGMKLQSCG